MRLSPSDVQAFFAIYKPLLRYAAARHVPVPADGAQWSYDAYIRARNLLWDDPTQCTSFISENPAQLAPPQLDVVRDWRDAYVRGQFLFIKSIREEKHAVLMRWEQTDDRFYGVLGLTEAVSRVAPHRMPFGVVLVPWRGRIVWDGLCAGNMLHIGPHMWDEITRRFRWHHARGRTVVTLAQRTPLRV